MSLRNDSRHALRRRSSLKPRLQRAYDALDLLRHQLQEEWEECVEELRLSRVGTSHDDDSVETSQAFLCRRSEQLAGEIRDLETALGRFAAGAYGVCVDCGRRIPAARLTARPEAVRCRACQETFEEHDAGWTAERRAPEPFPELNDEGPALPRPRAGRPARARAPRELSRRTGSGKTSRRAAPRLRKR